MSFPPSLSIAVPTYGFNGKGVFFLNRLFDSLKEQTCQEFEVVISDHSTDDKIQKYCQSSDHPFTVRYIRNSENIGNSPANTNNAIENSRGHLIKILFQDDFLCHPQALELTRTALLNHDASWLVCGSNDVPLKSGKVRDQRVPQWSKNLLQGDNKIGSPSIVTIKKEVEVRFDPALILLMDCEFYYNMTSTYGPPLIIPDVLVTNTAHPDQLSSKFNSSPDWRENRNSEVAYSLLKHLDK